MGPADHDELLGAVLNSSIVLACAVLASLAVGVLVAYGFCIAMFRVFQMHVRQVAAGNESRRMAASAQVVKS
jgi:ABC-type spermidine/putrescine transport system permease subunit II